MRDCPTAEQLECLVAGAADSDADLLVHARHCPHCRRWIDDARSNAAVLDDVRRVLSSEDHGQGSGHGEPLAAGPTRHPTSIGRYRIIRLLGEGGMGVVYEAEQDQPRRIVALKVLRSGFSSEERLRRFRHEAEILGRLHHPGIAQIHDAGAADDSGDSIAYYAMEFIDGRRLNEHADARGLDRQQRLALLAEICDAVQHAHDQGIIHRDLKPGNILVDSQGRPRILDFGVARATDCDAQVTTLRTDIGRLIGTIPYMSPEQVTGDSRRIDARCDIYALGVIGYELLAGRLPYELRGRIVPEAARIIRETDPVRLSSVDRALRGDVETIIAKALEKDPQRRYASAAEFAADVRRYLRHEPIAARPPSTLYQFNRFARRNRAVVAGAAVAGLGLLVGAVVAVWQAVEATRERDRARVQARKAQQISGFLRDMLASGSPIDTRHDLTVREMVDRAAAGLRDDRPADPEIEASIRRTLGDTYTGIGLYAEGEKQLRAAAELFDQAVGRGHPDAVSARFALAYTLSLMGDFPEAEALISDELSRLDAGSPDTDVLRATGLDQLVEILREKEDIPRAAAVCQDAVALHRTLRGDQHPHFARQLCLLGALRHASGDRPAGEQATRQALEIQLRVLGRAHRDTAWTMQCLGYLLRTSGQLEEARKWLNEALNVQREIFGEDHVEAAHTLTALAWLADESGDPVEAERLHLDSLAMRHRLLGESHVHIAMQFLSLGRFYSRHRRFDEAVSHLIKAVDMRRAIHGPDHPMVGVALHHLAPALSELRRDQEAVDAILDELRIAQHVRGDPPVAQSFPLDLPSAVGGRWLSVPSAALLGRCLLRLGRFQEAEPILSAAYGESQRRDVSQEDRAALARDLVSAYESLGLPADAARLRVEAETLLSNDIVSPAGDR